MNLQARLWYWMARKPLVLLRFEEGFEQALLDSRRGIDRFTIVKPHAELDGLKLPTLCLAEMPDEQTCKCYLGVIKSKSAVSTFDSRLTVTKLKALNLPSFESLVAKLVRRNFQAALKEKLATGRFALGLSPKLSAAIIEVLFADPENVEAIEDVAFNMPELRQLSATEWGQLDAISMAVAVFGLAKSDLPNLIDLTESSDSGLKSLDVRALEDNVIAKDASVIPGFSLIDKYVTGCAVFQNGGERLQVYTANRGLLETMLGVDLIYINDTLGNTVMVQYKMLEEHRDPLTNKTDWIFRPDGQLMDEVARMKLPTIPVTIADYRLHRNPFFFKFVKRKGDGESHHSFVISLDHLNQLLASARNRGPKGGLRMSVEGLDGVYLTESVLISLIRCGYVGTHRNESDVLRLIISKVAGGDRALVLAWQRLIEREDET